MSTPSVEPARAAAKDGSRQSNKPARERAGPTVADGADRWNASTEPVINRYPIETRHLKTGMFISELDRPWIDTPFLMQGFLLESEGERLSLIRHCKHVFVDLDMSDHSVVDAIRRAAMKKLPIDEVRPHRRFKFTTVDNSGSSRPLNHRRVTGDGRTRLKNYIHLMDPESGLKYNSMIGRIVAWLDRLLNQRQDRSELKAQAKLRHDELRKTLPPDMEIKRYQDTVSIEQELPRARKAFKKSEAALHSLASDVKSGRPPSLEKADEVVDDIVQSMIDNPDAMMWVARMRDTDMTTYGHAVNVALYMVALGRHMGFPKRELSCLGMIGLLADLGKTKLPKSILEKPSMLSPQEYTLVKEHVRLGLESLTAKGPMPADIIQGIAQHHERLDGSGYPKGLKGPQIGIFGRMAAIADTYSALTSARPYANAISPHDALLNLFEWAGSSFHEPLVEQFVQAVGVFPVGSMVELSTKEIAIVLAHNKVRRLEPRVLVLTWNDKTPLETPVERNLFDKPKCTDGRPIRILRAVPPGSHGIKIKDLYATNPAAGVDERL